MQLDPSTNTLYAGTDAGFLYALNVNDQYRAGERVLPFDAGDRIWSGPVAADGRVLLNDRGAPVRP
jgi:outer membrane protein assembly factor BamB